MPAPEDHSEGASADQVFRIVLVVAEDLHLSRPTGDLYRRVEVHGLSTIRERIARDRGSIYGPAVVCSKMTQCCHAASKDLTSHLSLCSRDCPQSSNYFWTLEAMRRREGRAAE